MLLGVGVSIALGLSVAAPALSGARLSDPSSVVRIGVAIALEMPSACVPMAMIATDRFGKAAAWDLTSTALILTATSSRPPAALVIPEASRLVGT